jgi:hypothetical protein
MGLIIAAQPIRAFFLFWGAHFFFWH